MPSLADALPCVHACVQTKCGSLKALTITSFRRNPGTRKVPLQLNIFRDATKPLFEYAPFNPFREIA